MKPAVQVQALAAADRAAWELLARGYKAFYDTPTSLGEFDAAWSRFLNDSRFVGLGAWQGGVLVGIVHALFHASTWAEQVCYLQDLFVAEAARDQGAAEALIDAVAHAARERQAAPVLADAQRQCPGSRTV